MTPEEAARALHEELDAAFADPTLVGASPRILSILAPEDLAADRTFAVTLQLGDADPVTLHLPAGLAIAYLADEEAAVDEWRRWVSDALGVSD